MVVNEEFQDGVQAVADAEAVAKGLLVVLEELEGKVSGDSRYYALKACVERIVWHLGVAGDRLDKYSMEADESDKALDIKLDDDGVV